MYEHYVGAMPYAQLKHAHASVRHGTRRTRHRILWREISLHFWREIWLERIE